MPGPGTAAAAAEAPPPHYATLGELHSHGLGALAKRNPELLGKISKYGADADIQPGISGTPPPPAR